MVFKKVLLTGLNSLWQKGYRISVKIWIFDNSINKKGTVLVILVPGQLSGPRSSLVKYGFWGCRSRWGCRGQWGQWGCRGSKAWKITTEDFRVIKILEFSFILMFWRILFFWYNHEISYWILAPFLSEAVEASRCYFLKNQQWISKIYYLRIPKLLSNKILVKYFNLSGPIQKIQFNVRYPVFCSFLNTAFLQLMLHFSVLLPLKVNFS